MELNTYGDSLPNENRIEGDVFVYGSNGPVGTHQKPNTSSPVIVIGRKGSYGKLNYSEKPVFSIDTTYFVDNRYTQMNLRWLYFGFQTLGLDTGSKDSAVPGLDREDAYEKRLMTPPLENQKQIADFLDKETTRIDTLISKKQKQIELLQEKRQAIITQSVTKGLNPEVKMKDSGVEWIGEIPEHWDVKRLRHIGNAIIGLTYSPNDVTDETEGTLVLRASNIHNGRITLEDNVYVNTRIPEKLRTKKGDILICSRNGSEKLVGKSGMITSNEERLSFGAFTTIFRSDVNDYLFYFFNSGMMREQSGLFNTSTVFQLTTGILNNLRVAIPSEKEERNEVVKYLKDETEKIEVLVSKIQESIDLLKEYRSSLITHAVSGQIDISKYEVSK